MTTSEKEAVATLCLMAAFADGQKGGEEREHIKAVVETLEGVSTPALYQRVLLNKVTLEEAAGALERPETRSLAFEMAVGVCDADGVMNPSERAFLEKLGRALGLSDDTKAEVEKTAEALAAGALSERPTSTVTPVTPATPVTPVTSAVTAKESGDALSSSTPDETDLDAMILNHAVLAGALELLPQSLATVAILPLQMKLVYSVSQRHGYALDGGSVREFLAVAGVGATSQVFEGYARKLFGSVAKKALGKGGKKLTKSATGALLTFATTYGLGQVAVSYYAGGRTLTPGQIQGVFADKLEQGKALFAQHQDAVRAQSERVNLRDLVGMVGR